MMDDNRSKNYNSIIVSLVSELIFENDNKELNRSECYDYIVNDLKIKLQKDVFVNIIEKSKNFEHKPNTVDVGIKLSNKKFTEINDNIEKHSIERHIDDFVKEKELPKEFKQSIESLLYQAIYENINSFTIQNIHTLLPDKLKDNYTEEEIEAFNDFLSSTNHNKNSVLFNTFLKAVEFAIITSGKGVKEFTKGIFEGKEYLLDANIIFRLLGVGGIERQESLLNLIKQCNHQGITFLYSNESYQEFKRKVEASIIDIKRATESKSISLLEELIQENQLEFNEGFITHYAECKISKLVRSPEQYETKIMADFRTLCKTYKINASPINGHLKAREIELLQDELYNKKKEKNERSFYTKTAAKVDAINVLTVKHLRRANEYNYSDIKSFYLSTDRTLNSILAEKAGQKIAETILPSQLFILHNSLSENEDDKDYIAFTKFLKRRTTEFKYSGRQILTYIDEIRNFTTDPENIKEVLKAFSDKKYETSLLDIDVEPEYVSIKEFAESYIDSKLKKAEFGDEKYKLAFDNAISNFPSYLKFSKNVIRVLDVILTILLIPITILVVRVFVQDLFIIIVSVIGVEVVKFILSSRWNYYSSWTKKIFVHKVKKSDFNKTFKTADKAYLNRATEYINKDIKIWE